MSSELSNQKLLEKCKRFILDDMTKEHLDYVIQDALVTAVKEINNLGGALPMAWNREQYDEFFTRYYATISAITNANPGVITADSVDPELSSDHGFQTNDLVYLDGIAGEDSYGSRLNRRFFRAVRASATTLTLKTLDGQTAIDTTDYDTYSAGGMVYHAGFVLPASTIQPTDSWVIKRLWNVAFDGYPSHPIADQQAIEEGWIGSGGRPEKWRYQKYTYSDFTATNIEHLLFWYGATAQRYNVNVMFEKTYPDMVTFDKDNYPSIPSDLHDYIWHRALSNLATQAEKQKRQTATQAGIGANTKMEIVNAQYWILKAAQDEIDILAYNRSLLGYIPQPSGSMSA